MTTSIRVARALAVVLATSALACVARTEEPLATSGQGTSDVATGSGPHSAAATGSGQGGDGGGKGGGGKDGGK